MAIITKRDLLNLRWSLVLFAVLALAGGVTLSIAMKMFNEAQGANQRAARVKTEASNNAAQPGQVEQELREKIARYQDMTARGIIGQEHRIDWIEAIRSIKQSRKLLDVKYEIGPQELIKPELAAAELSGYEIVASPMKLDMQLLHEDDLLGFLADLRARVQGFVRVQSCDVAALAQPPVERGPTPQLQASCELAFITIPEHR